MTDLTPWIEWARSRYPGTLPVSTINLPSEIKGVERAALNVLTAHERASADKEDEGAAFSLGSGLNGLASHLKQLGRSAESVATFEAAYDLLTTVYPRDNQADHAKRAIGFALANLGSTPAEAPSLVPGDAYWLMLDEVLNSFVGESDEPGVTLEIRRGPTQARPVRETVALLASDWGSEQLDLEVTLDAFTAQVAREFDRTGLLDRELGGLFRKDSDRALELLRPFGLPAARSDLETSTRTLRNSGFRGLDADDRQFAWFLSCFFNYVLWTAPEGLDTNRPQFQIDLTGYLCTIVIERRYRDSDRDLVLDCCEAEVRVVSSMAEVVVNRLPFVRSWLESAVGTYLLLAGPNPSRPSESYYDSRIHSEDAPDSRGLGRAERNDWAGMLLNLWQNDGESIRGACYVLSSIAGWDLARATWLIQFVFSRDPNDKRPVERDFWIEQVVDLLGRVDRVRVATNPWASSGDAKNRASMITREESGGLTIPDPILRAAAAEGLKSGDAITIHGKLFAGRRVPTYLISNRFGPFAILKIDEREKVIREAKNFDAFAMRLHQSHRPSNCSSDGMDMYLGEDGTPLRAIQTSYVFDRDDRTLTLQQWLESNTRVDESVKVIDNFLLSALRPWLAHVRRTRIDLRVEYPVFRPAPAPDKQSPGRWAQGEIEVLKRAVRRDLGHEIGETRELPGSLKDALGLSGKDGSLNAVLGDKAWVDPVWLAAEIAELGEGSLTWLVDSLDVGLRDFDTLITLCHGDLHLENILCTGPDDTRPRLVLIDFESTHHGHVCKDLARVEASALCQTATWTDAEFAQVAGWFASGELLGAQGALLGAPPVADANTRVASATAISARVREVAAGCGQSLWPISSEEYLIALLGSLLPMARFSTATATQRRAALVLATVAATALLEKWEAKQT